MQREYESVLSQYEVLGIITADSCCENGRLCNVIQVTLSMGVIVCYVAAYESVLGHSEPEMVLCFLNTVYCPCLIFFTSRIVLPFASAVPFITFLSF